jgi:hypothetical protein
MLSQAEDAIRAEEREACAKIADGCLRTALQGFRLSATDGCVNTAVGAIAAQIRARGKA